MFTVFKQLSNREMSIVGNYASLTLANTAATTASAGGVMVQIEARERGGSRIVSTIGTPLGL